MAEMALGYGSEYQLMRYLGHHRNYLNKKICEVIGEGVIEWFDYPVNLNHDSRDGEIKGIKCFEQLSNYEEIIDKWKSFWPTRGNVPNWDGIFISDGIWYFVEAKAHFSETRQKCSAESKESINTIISAFESTCSDRVLAEKWQKSNCYQLANRLAFIHFCKTVGIMAKVLYIGFINGYDVNPNINVKNISDWENECKKEYDILELTQDLKNDIICITINCHED